MSGRPRLTPEEQAQEDLMRLDAYRNQLNSMLQQLQYLSASRSDHLRAREALEGLDRVDADRELLVPLGGDTYVRTAPAPQAPVLIGVGSGVFAELDRGKVSELLAERSMRLEQATTDLEGQIRGLEERIQLLTRRLEAMSQGAPPGATDATTDVGGD
ncbi:MAG: prefoldin subunit alpha [Thermoplasmata archaeon]